MLVDKYDPATNSTIKVPVQTGGVGMGGVNPSSGVTTGGAVPGSAPGFNMGQKAPEVRYKNPPCSRPKCVRV